jgi:CarD family transcriptional regulator
MVETAFRATADLDRVDLARAEAGEMSETMGFQQGDFVVYPTHGVGRVDRVGVEVVAGHLLNLIQISFSENRMILRVPLAKAHGAGLRALSTVEMFAEVLITLAGRPRQSRLLWAKRAQAYQARINSGDVHVLAEVVRDLQTAPGGSNASFSQRNLFEMALERLAAEFAVVSQSDKTQATELLVQAMQRGRATAAALAKAAADAADAEPFAPEMAEGLVLEADAA